MMVVKMSELSWQGWMQRMMPMMRQLHDSVGAISKFMTKLLSKTKDTTKKPCFGSCFLKNVLVSSFKSNLLY